jgi:hypothetical protein
MSKRLNEWYLYEIIDLENGKTYVGQRKKAKNEDPTSWYYASSSTILQGTKTKRGLFEIYGMARFRKVVLYDNTLSKEEIDTLEKSTIATKQQQNIGCQYNLHEGGTGGATLKQYVMITDNVATKHILKDELDEYLAKGWQQGMSDKNKAICAKSLPHGRKPGFVIAQETRDLISTNTKKAMIKAKENGKQIGRKAGEEYGFCYTKGKIHINNGVKDIVIDEQDFLNYPGWVKGGLQKKRSGYIYMNKEGVNKRVNLHEISSHLDDGYQKGRLQKGDI